MRGTWVVALAAGAMIGLSMPADVAAQGNSKKAKQQQVERRQQTANQRQQADRQRHQTREQARREAERERIRREEEIRREANRRGLVIRRTDDRRDRDRDYDRRDRDYDRRDDRYDDRNRRDDPWDIFGRRDDDRRYDDRYDDRYNRNGPAFCRSGQGHPVHGRQWCRNKGFGLGRENSRDIWGDIIYRDRRYDDRRLSRSTLGDILGSVVLGRFDSYGRQYYGSSGTLNGRWLDTRGGVLQLFMGSTPIARLIDTNRDGRVDSVSLMR